MTRSMMGMIFLFYIFAAEIIRLPYRTKNKENRKMKNIALNRIAKDEVKFMMISFFGMWIMPFVYNLTNWFRFADYSLPQWVSWVGLGILMLAFVVLLKAHIDLGWNWSPSLEMNKGHKLVTKGIYAYLRHPIYAALWLQVIAQMILLPNWIAGLIGVITFAPIYFTRVPKEEQMMLEKFGEEYKIYMVKTPRIIPLASEVRIEV